MSKSRIFLLLLVAFVAGVGVRSFGVLPFLVIEILLLGAVAVVIISFLRGHPAYAVYGCMLIMALGGMMRYEAAERAAPDLSHLYGKTMRFQGIVVEDPVAREANQRMKIKVMSVDGDAQMPHFFVLATMHRFPAYRRGDEMRLTGKIERPENYGDFDYVSYLRRDNVFALTPFPRTEKIGEGKGSRIILLLSRIKHAFEENIDMVLPEPHAAFMKGLLLGERASLPEKVTDTFKQAGVSHIVALSGYNITLVGRSLMSFLLILTLPFTISFWAAITAITLFILMTGAAASVVRAGIMGVLVLVAQKEGRTYHMTNALAVAAAAMIFHNPYILRFDAGFQLSFLATAGLVYLSPHVEQWLDRARAKLSFGSKKFNVAHARKKQDDHQDTLGLKRILVETLSAQLMVLPLLIWLFGSVSLVSLLANLAVLVVVPFAMAAGALAGVLGFLSPLIAIPAGWVAWIILEYQLRVIGWFARAPFSSVPVGTWAVGPILIAYVLLFLRMKKRPRLFIP